MSDDQNPAAAGSAITQSPTSTEPVAADSPERMFTAKEVEAIVRDRLSRVKKVGGEDAELVFAERLAKVEAKHAEELAAAVGRAIERTIERLGSSAPSSLATRAEKFYRSPEEFRRACQRLKSW